MKCAPYIKNLCNSLHSWREGGSLPGSPVKLAVVVPSPTKSEGGEGTSGESLAIGPQLPNMAEDEDEILCSEKAEDGSVVAVRMTAAAQAAGCSATGASANHKTSLVVSTTGTEGEYVTTTVPSVVQQQPTSSMKSDLIQALKKIRPESPDVTRAAKRFEMAKQQGAIAKKLSLSPR